MNLTQTPAGPKKLKIVSLEGKNLPAQESLSLDLTVAMFNASWDPQS